MTLPAASLVYYEIRFDTPRYVHADTVIGQKRDETVGFADSGVYTLTVGNQTGNAVINN
jgi:hypothetical protein